jgi:hypothetical protein
VSFGQSLFSYFPDPSPFPVFFLSAIPVLYFVSLFGQSLLGHRHFLDVIASPSPINSSPYNFVRPAHLIRVANTESDLTAQLRASGLSR